MSPWIRTSSFSVQMCHLHFPASPLSRTSGDPAAGRPQALQATLLRSSALCWTTQQLWKPCMPLPSCSPVPCCQPQPPLRSASAASSLLASPLAGCGASLSATSCAASSRVRSHSSSRESSTRPPGRINTRCSLPATQRGLKVLGTPLGTDEFVAAHLDFLSAQHRAFLELLPTLPDLQVAWLLLLYCACPRAQYVLRILPPALTAAFAAEHDHSILSCLAQLLQVEASSDSPLPALIARRAHLSLRLGGLGLRSASAHAPAAYFASWADSLRAIAGQDRPFSDSLLHELASTTSARCVASLKGAAVVLAHHGFEAPPWADLLAAPLPPDELSQEEPADFGRGWQRAASNVLDDHEAAEIAQASDAASLAMLQSQGAVRWARLHRPPHQPRSLPLCGIPPAPPASTAFAASTRLSRLPVRSTPRLFWRSPGRLPPRWTFALPGRAFGASSCQGLPRGRSNGCSQCFAPRPQCHRAAPRWPTPRGYRKWTSVVGWGPARRRHDARLGTRCLWPSATAPAPHPRRRLRIARLAKERTCIPELIRALRCRLVVLAIEVAGRWSSEAVEFVRLLARSRARSAPARLRANCASACSQRWSGILAFAAVRAFAASLQSAPLHGTANVDGPIPALSDLLAEERYGPDGPVASRLPPRG